MLLNSFFGKVLRKIIMPCLLSVMVAGHVNASDSSESKMSPEEMLEHGVRVENIKMVKEALEKGASPNMEIDRVGPVISLQLTGLLSQSSRTFEIAKMLIDHGADLEFLNGHGENNFAFVVEYCMNIDIIILLIKHGVKLKNSGLLEKYYSDYSLCKFFLEHGADPNETMNPQKETPLHRAVSMESSQANRLKIVQMLLDHGASVSALDKDCRTPLHHAVNIQVSEYKEKERTEIVKLLIKRGADVNALAGCREYKVSTLNIHLGSEYPQYGIVEALLNHGARLQKDEVRKIFMGFSDSEIAGILVRSLDPALITDGDTYERMALLCSKKCAPDVINKLFQSKWLPLMNQDLLASCLWSAAREGNTEAARFYIKKGAKVNRTDFLNGEYDRVKIKDLLPDFGERTDEAQQELDSALYEAVNAADTEKIHELLKKGADPNGMACLHVAVKNYDFETVKILVNAKAEVDSRDKHNVTPLMYACSGYSHNYPENGFAIITYLVEKGANVNAAIDNNERKGYILCEAVDSDDLKLVDFLLKKGADPNGINGRKNLFGVEETAVLYALDPLKKNLTDIRWETHTRTKEMGCKNPFGDNRSEFYYTVGFEKKNNGLAILKKLVGHGANLNKKWGSSDYSVFHYATEGQAKFVDKALVLYLIEHADIKSSYDYYNCARIVGLSLLEGLAKRKHTKDYQAIFEGAVAGGHLELAIKVMDKLCLKNQKDRMVYFSEQLCEAVKNDRGNMIDFFVENGIQVKDQVMEVKNSRGTYKTTLIVAAAYLGCLNAFEHLYRHGADIHRFDEKGMNALCAAADEGNLPIVNFLIKQNVDLNVVSPHHGFTPLMFTTQWTRRDDDGNYNVADELLVNGADPLIKDKDGRTAIGHALARSTFDIAALLTIHGAPILNEPDFSKHSDEMMNYLTGECCIELFKEFYKKLPENDPRFAGPALIGAVEHSNDEIFTFLLNQKINFSDYAAQALLAAASMKVEKGLPMIKPLLSLKPDLNRTNKDGKTALLVALENKDDDKALIAKCLLEYEVDVNVHCPEGMTPLMYAVARSERDMVKTILNKNGKVNYQMKATNWGNYTKILGYNLMMLVSTHPIKRFNEFNEAMKAANKNTSFKGPTALVFAAGQEDVEILNLLLDAGADMGFRSVNNATILFVAAHSGNVKNVALLLEKGADINSIDDDGLNVLMTAARSGHRDCVEFLLKKGVNPELKAGKGEDGMTAFLFAVKMGHTKVVEALIKHGCRTDVTNKDGKTALELTDNSQIKALLLAAAKNESK